MLQEFLCAAPTRKTAALLSDSNTPKDLRNNILLIKQTAMATMTWVAWRLQTFCWVLLSQQSTHQGPTSVAKNGAAITWCLRTREQLQGSCHRRFHDFPTVLKRGCAAATKENKYSWDIKFIFHPFALGFHIFVWLLVQTVDDKIPLNTRSFCRIPLL